MTYVIAEPCIDVMDQSCVSVCPVDCIHFDQGTDRMLFIDPDECIDCGACEPECPVNAIYPEDSAARPSGASYTEVNATWYKDKGSARATARRVEARLTARLQHATAGARASRRRPFDSGSPALAAGRAWLSGGRAPRP